MNFLKLRLTLLTLIISAAIQAQTLDARLLHAINSPNPQSVDGFFKFMSQSTSIIVLATPASIGFTGIINKDKSLMYNACTIGLAGALNAGVSLALKYTINRPRPYEKYPDYIHPKLNTWSASMPSAHTSTAFANATALSLIFPKWYVIVPSYLWAGTVAYSRLHLGMHYPSDVLVGILVGVGSAYLSYKGNQWLIKKYNYLGN